MPESKTPANRNSKLKEFALQLESKGISDFSDLQKMIINMRKHTSTEDSFIDYVLNEPDLNEIIRKYSANKETLKSIFSYLELAGAGQWANDYFVAVAAIGFPETLDLLLSNFKDNKFSYNGLDHKNSLLKIAYEMCIYFEHK